MTYPRRSPTIIPSIGIAQSSLGPVQGSQDAPPCWRVRGVPGLFFWALGDAHADDDGATCIETSGGQQGRFVRERCPDRGDDLPRTPLTIYPSGKRWRVLPAATLTANTILTLGVETSTESVEEGDWILITREDVGAFTYTIANGGTGGGNVAIMPVSQRAWCLTYFNGTNWVPRASGLGLGIT